MDQEQPCGNGWKLLVPGICGAAAIVLIPLLLGALDGVPAGHALALAGSALVIEYGAGVVGIALGFSPVATFLILASVGLGLIVVLFAIFMVLGETSGRVARFLAKTEARMERHPFIRKWGIIALIPGVLILGIYFIAPVAWILRWEIRSSAPLIFAGYLIGSVVTILGALGLFRLFLS